MCFAMSFAVVCCSLISRTHCLSSATRAARMSRRHARPARRRRRTPPPHWRPSAPTQVPPPRGPCRYSSKTSRSQNRAASAKSCRTTTTPPPLAAFWRSRFHHLQLMQRIERRHRLVRQQHRRLDRERARKQRAHPLAAGDLVHGSIAQGRRYPRRAAHARSPPGRPQPIAGSGGDAAAGRAPPALRHASASAPRRLAPDRRSAATARLRRPRRRSCPHSAPGRCRSVRRFASARSSVVLPEPFGPIRPTISPASAEKSTPRSASTLAEPH